MIKLIRTEELTVGMHIKSFAGSWLKHPFWRRNFRVDSQADLDHVRKSGVREVWIDTEQGTDLSPPQATTVRTPPPPEPPRLDSVVPTADRLPQQVPLADELQRATEICLESKAAMIAIFDEARMGRAVNGADARQLVSNIGDSLTRNVGALISLARLKTVDDYTYMHSVSVCAMMMALARQLGLDENQVRSAGLAGLLHDLGKAVIPSELLNKPDTLTDGEFAIMQSHPDAGHRLLQSTLADEPLVLEVCLHHHERIDGSGYPHQLADKQIGLFARMGAVCDVYDALTSNRAYKTGWDPALSLRRMAEWTGTHLDERVFQAFVKSIGIYPVGSLVTLSSGFMGIVIEQGKKALTMPRVKVFYSQPQDRRIRPYTVDLSEDDCRDKITGREDPAKWGFGDLNTLWMDVH